VSRLLAELEVEPVLFHSLLPPEANRRTVSNMFQKLLGKAEVSLAHVETVFMSQRQHLKNLYDQHLVPPRYDVRPSVWKKAALRLQIHQTMS